MRSGFACAFCGTSKDLIPSPIVPASYGGPSDASNFRALCVPCDKNRHRAEGSDPEPPDAETLDRLYALDWPRLTRGIIRLLHMAATTTNPEELTGTWIKGFARDLAGWDLKYYKVEKPDMLSQEDWEFLCGSLAYSAIFDAAYQLMPSDPIRPRRRRRSRRNA